MKIIKVIAFFLLIALFASLIYFVPRLLIIKEIRCSSQFGPCKQSIVENLSGFEQKSFFETKKNIDAYFLDNTLVSDYAVQFKLPCKLHVNVIEKKPVFGMKANQDSEVALVDKDGEVIGKEKASALPILVTNALLPETGDFVSPKILFALKIVSGMHSTYHVSEGLIEDTGLIFNLKDGLSVAFPLEGDVEVLMGSLNSILNQLNIDAQGTKIVEVDGVKLIDLRFKNPVLR